MKEIHSRPTIKDIWPKIVGATRQIATVGLFGAAVVVGAEVAAQSVNPQLLDVSALTLGPLIEPIAPNGFLYIRTPSVHDPLHCDNITIVATHRQKPGEKVHLEVWNFMGDPSYKVGKKILLDLSDQTLVIKNISCPSKKGGSGIALQAENGSMQGEVEVLR